MEQIKNKDINVIIIKNIVLFSKIEKAAPVFST